MPELAVPPPIYTCDNIRLATTLAALGHHVSVCLNAHGGGRTSCYFELHGDLATLQRLPPSITGAR